MAAHISYHHTVPPHSILRVLDCLRTMSIVPLRAQEPIPARRETVMVRRVGDTPLRWSHRTIVPLESLAIRDEDATCWTPIPGGGTIGHPFVSLLGPQICLLVL